MSGGWCLNHSPLTTHHSRDSHLTCRAESIGLECESINAGPGAGRVFSPALIIAGGFMRRIDGVRFPVRAGEAITMETADVFDPAKLRAPSISRPGKSNQEQTIRTSIHLVLAGAQPTRQQ